MAASPLRWNRTRRWQLPPEIRPRLSGTMRMLIAQHQKDRHLSPVAVACSFLHSWSRLTSHDPPPLYSSTGSTDASGSVRFFSFSAGLPADCFCSYKLRSFLLRGRGFNKYFGVSGNSVEMASFVSCVTSRGISITFTCLKTSLNKAGFEVSLTNVDTSLFVLQ